jgi:hypothetical protein
MEMERVPDMIMALYTALADAQAAQEELQDNNFPYPNIRMQPYSAADADGPALDMPNPPEHFWSLAVLLDEPGRGQAAEEVLQRHGPFALGRLPAPNAGRSSADRGAIAWRHYVFETPAASDAIGDAAGTTGTTGVISSGVFANAALAEGNPPARGLPSTERRPANDQADPTTELKPDE